MSEANFLESIGMEFPVLCDRMNYRSVILDSVDMFSIDITNKLGETGADTIRLYI